MSDQPARVPLSAAQFTDVTPPRRKPSWIGKQHGVRLLDEATAAALRPAALPQVDDDEELGLESGTVLASTATEEADPGGEGSPAESLLAASAPSHDPIDTVTDDLKPVPDEASLAMLDHAIAEVWDLRKQVLAEAERQLVELAFAIARRVLAQELKTDPRVLLALAREGIATLDARDRVVIRVGQLARGELVEEWADLLRLRAPGAELVQDATLGPGDCVVETDFGRVDESVESRLATLMAALLPPEGEPGA